MTDRCRWIVDRSAPEGRYFVPGCWARAVNQDADCICPGAQSEDAFDELVERVQILEGKVANENV